MIFFSACEEKYIPQPNKVAFATDLWQRTYQFADGLEWIPVYQLGTTDTDRDHYIKFHFDTVNTTGIINKDFSFPEGDSLLIKANKYIGYLKIKQLHGGEIGNPRVFLILDGNESILPKTGMDKCFMLY